MSEDIYAKPDLTKKVRLQADEKVDRNTDVGENDDNDVLYDNYCAEGSSPPKSQDNTTEEQQQTATSVNVSSEKRNLLRVAAAVFLGLLCLLLLAGIAGIITLIEVKNNLNVARNRLLVDNHNLTRERDELESINHNLTRERDELQTNYSEMKVINHNLTRERDELESTNHNLTQKTIQLEDKNNNLTKERDELQKYFETTCSPANWIKFRRSCYFISTTAKNWDNSKAFCESHDAQLVIISSFEEQLLLLYVKENKLGIWPCKKMEEGKKEIYQLSWPGLLDWSD